MAITLNISRDLEKKLMLEAKLKGLNLDSYIEYLLEQNTSSGSFPRSSEEKELELIYKINQQGLTQKEWEEYNELKKKKKAETLENSELNQLTHYSNKLELLTARRLSLLVELAQVKGLTLDKLMDSLDIQAPVYE